MTPAQTHVWPVEDQAQAAIPVADRLFRIGDAPTGELAGGYGGLQKAVDLRCQVRLCCTAKQTQAHAPVGGAHGEQIDVLHCQHLVELFEALVTLDHRHQVGGGVGLLQRPPRIFTQVIGGAGHA